jgi:hypothetical protein
MGVVITTSPFFPGRWRTAQAKGYQMSLKDGEEFIVCTEIPSAGARSK